MEIQEGSCRAVLLRQPKIAQLLEDSAATKNVCNVQRSTTIIIACIQRNFVLQQHVNTNGLSNQRIQNLKYLSRKMCYETLYLIMMNCQMKGCSVADIRLAQIGAGFKQ